MDFSLTEEQRALQDAARRFAQGELVALSRDLERDNAPVPDDMRRRYGALGFLGVNVASDYGGLGLGNLEALIVLEEFGKISSAIAFPVFESCVGPVKAIEHFAGEALRRKVLPRVCTGEIVIGVSMSEPDAGTGLTDLTTRARIGETEIVVDGHKRWTSGGGHSDGYVVYARMADTPGAKGLGAVYVEKDRSGVSFGAPEALMGFRGVPSADIHLEDVRVPVENLIVPAGGFAELMQAFDLERCGNATMALAQAAAAFEQALAYSQERKQFGKPICEFQAVQLKLAEMAMRVDASRLLIHRAVSAPGAGLPSVAEASIAKCFANEIAREVCGTALQVMGAYGYSSAFDVERRFRDSWGWGIAGGTIDIQKVNIASALVGRRFDQRR